MTRRLIAVLAIWWLSGSALAKDQHAAPVPVDPGSWFSSDDYPDSALRAHQSGEVLYRLTIDDAGRVMACAITRSSGVPALDNQTCTSLMQRARFEPARHPSPKGGYRTYEKTIKWAIPEGIDGVEPTMSRNIVVSAKVDPQGQLVSCGVNTDVSTNAGFTGTCQAMVQSAARLGIAQRDDAPAGIILYQETTMEFAGQPVTEQGMDQVIELGRTATRFHVDPTGSIGDCRETSTGALFLPSTSPCGDTTRYSDKDGKFAETDGTFTVRSGWRRDIAPNGI